MERKLAWTVLTLAAVNLAIAVGGGLSVENLGDLVLVLFGLAQVLHNR